jgi:CheY-like chemotaxis protein
MNKVSILVVEDEAIMREALVDYFSGEGHEVDTADDGNKALEYNLVDYHIMIIDLKLPGRDGLSVLKEARLKNPKVKIIIITAFPTEESRLAALHGGAIDYLPKPFELEYLKTLIQQSYRAEDSSASFVEPIVEEVPVPVEIPVVEPFVEEEITSPCIWAQAGIVNNRLCPNGYQCTQGCKFHAAMMKKEKFRNDPRIKPYIDKVNSLLGGKLCRYTMTEDISLRSCPRLYHCERCEFDQVIQDEVVRQLAIKNAHRKKIHA